MMVTHDRIEGRPGLHGQIPGVVPGTAGSAHGRFRGARSGQQALTWNAMAALLTAATGSMTRQMLAHTLANVCILGGIVGAPVISVLAWIGMVLSDTSPLHQAAPALMTGALIWLALAIIGAHAFRLDRREKQDGEKQDGVR
jgi:hypothetical protein